jgi:tetratricopeptide (TPR) repeat protein
MSSLKLLIYGLVSEQAALAALFGKQPLWQQFLLFLSGHLIASTLFALLLSTTFPPRFSTSKKRLFGFFFIFIVFVPAFGVAAAVLMLLYFRWYLKHGERAEFSTVLLPPFLAESADLGAGMGEGGAWSRLRTAGLPKEKRLQALMSLGTASGLNASRFLQHATGDSDDEIRLLAFNLYARQEQKIQQAISAALNELNSADTPEQKSSVCRNLAFSYWEMVYSALAQDDLRDFFIEQALKYANQAQQSDGNDPALLVLIARIHLQKHEYEQAQQVLQAALAAGADPLKTIPYQAELAFHARDFTTVKKLLMQDASLRFRPCIGPVGQFWGAR